MDYITASGKLTGRCKDSRKLCNNTYLKRRSNTSIAVRLHGTDVLTFHQNGKVIINTGGWNTVTTKDRINAYWSQGRVWSESGRMFASTDNHAVAFCRSVTMSPDKTLDGVDPEIARKEIREERNERNRTRNRARYWTAKARSGKPFKGTVADIFAEENQTVRVAKMRCYGIERFFVDAKPTVIDERAGYQLLALPLVGQVVTGDRWREMYALKMACTTTGAVYINTVPTQCQTVPDALDWIFDTKDYLGTIGQQA